LEKLAMKKSLIALAALAATASFAQSSVTLSGVVDFAYGAASGNATTADTKLNTVSSSSYTSSTSAINIAVTEDLGGGMKAEGRYEIDPRAWSNGSGINSAGTIGRHQAFVGLSGGFGAIKLGVMNAGALTAFGAATPLGTGIGTNFTGADHTTVSPAGVVRFNNSVRYDTPNFNGFAASLTYAPGNDDATKGGALPEITNIGLTYSNGPLNVAFSSLQTSATGAQAAVTTTATAIGTAAVNAAPKGTFNFIGANYAIGAAKVFVGYGDGDKSGAAGADVKQTRVGATYSMGAVTLLGQYTELEIGTTAKRKTTGLRADYALSKRSAAYIGYEADNQTALAAGKRNLAAIGIRHSF